METARDKTRLLFSNLYELDGLSGVCPGSRDLVARPHDRNALG